MAVIWSVREDLHLVHGEYGQEWDQVVGRLGDERKAVIGANRMLAILVACLERRCPRGS